jgi:hypothetical protein
LVIIERIKKSNISMIPYAKDRFSKENVNIFTLLVPDYQNNWEYYYIQYSKVLDFLLGIANEKHYQINCQHRTFMFIFRHTVELMLKYVANEKGIAPRNTHNLKELANEIDADFSMLISALPNLFPEDDGAMFKYDASKDGSPYFGVHHILYAYSDCQAFVRFTKSNEGRFSLYPISQDVDINDKKLKHELSFYTHECRGLGVIRSHYDITIDMLVSSVIKGQLSINDIYLPLLFLLRHGIELALKSNIQDIGNKVPIKKQQKIGGIHSIEQLYHILLSYIEPAVEKIPQGDKFKIETESFIQNVAKLNNCIHNLDVHSRAFRFPSVERPLALKRDSLVEALKLYYSTDAFLTNAVKVLMYSGYLEVGDDKLAEFYY